MIFYLFYINLNKNLLYYVYKIVWNGFSITSGRNNTHLWSGPIPRPNPTPYRGRSYFTVDDFLCILIAYYPSEGKSGAHPRLACLNSDYASFG